MALHAQIVVGLPDDPKIIDAGDIAELVYMRCILRSREHLTDGVIDRRLLLRWMAGIRGNAVTHMTRLVAVGLLEEHPDGWCIPIDKWRRWNPTKEEVETKRDAETERKRQWKDKNATTSRDVSRRDNDNRRDRQPEPEPEPISNTRELAGDDSPDPGPSSPPTSAEFNQWWLAYPRKLAKADARKAWNGIKAPKPPLDDLIAALSRLAGIETQFIPYPATWLRRRRWEDEPDTANDAPIWDAEQNCYMSKYFQ